MGPRVASLSATQDMEASLEALCQSRMRPMSELMDELIPAFSAWSFPHLAEEHLGLYPVQEEPPSAADRRCLAALRGIIGAAQFYAKVAAHLERTWGAPIVPRRSETYMIQAISPSQNSSFVVYRLLIIRIHLS